MHKRSFDSIDCIECVESPTKLHCNNSVSIANTLSIHHILKDYEKIDKQNVLNRKIYTKICEYMDQIQGEIIANLLANPVSLRQINLIQLKKYVVLPKANGTRYLFIACMIENDFYYAFMDRANEFYVRCMNHVEKKMSMVLDCELVGNTQFHNNYHLWVLDIMYYDNVSRMQWNFKRRMDNTNLQLFSNLQVCIKPFFKTLEECKLWMLNGSNSKIEEQYDGFILMPDEKCVQIRTHQTMFKWKKNETIDLLIECANGEYNIFCCQQNASDLSYNSELISLRNGPSNIVATIPFTYLSEIISHENKIQKIYECSIIECKKDSKIHIQCSLDRERTDKKYANTWRVVCDAIQIKLENIKQEDIDYFLLK